MDFIPVSSEAGMKSKLNICIQQNLILLVKIYFQLRKSDVILLNLLEGHGLDVQRMFRPTDYLRKVS
ncbi:hypothetical protein CH352_05980 [Leptospira hartskeerlii]|uniref:Uncharacterized protein n=2 Tax=Leptospira hartskeerlii TaxID=2023177 RepID=A0A2M9XER4_9LEPT|nr:hypothetical protein CH357_06385 [Leptospira hartskeerlii]PJZ34208.1 hypothetical protein CH352_05980 [Leptospira hartskeerlii]